MVQIYLVEDSPLVRERLEKLITAVPGAAIVGHAATAGAAISGIFALRPHMVVLDLQLAEGTGFDVLRALARQAPEIEVLMLSNFAAEPYRRLAAKLGAREFFDKTKDFERVREMVSQRAEAN